MTLNCFSRAIMGAVLLAAGGTLAWAATTPDQMVAAREHQMKSYKEALGSLAKIYKGKTPYTDAAVQAQVAAIVKARDTAMSVNAWSTESQQGKKEHAVKSEVWTQPDAFKAAWDKLDMAIKDMSASKDMASFKTSFDEMGAACKGCHEKFRKPE